MIGAWYTRLVRAVLGFLRRKAGEDAPLGARGEEIAYWYLRERGFTMVARNYRRGGAGCEVDLIGWDRGTLVFVEVKTRRSDEVRKAEDAVDLEKRRHIVRAAQDYRRRAHVEAPHRYDVVAVYPQPGGPPRVEYFREAFTEASLA